MTDEKVGGLAGMAYFKQRWPGWTVKAEGVYGQNLYHLMMLGGYAVGAVIDPVRRAWEYTPLKTMSFWAEAQTNGVRWQTGVFAGWSRNLGARREIVGPTFARGANIAELFRLSPRLLYNAGKLRLAGELEITGAACGTPDSLGQVRDAKSVTNAGYLSPPIIFSENAERD